jgi:hypothetical protein
MPRSKDILAGVYTGRQDRWRGVKTCGLIGLVVGMIVVLFFFGENVQRYFAYTDARGSDGTWPAVTLTDPLREIVLNTYRSLPRPESDASLVDSGLPVYDLHIAPKELRKLHEVAEAVTARIVSTDVVREYVPATFWMDGERVPIKVKNRGLTSMHYLVTRPSLRLKFPADRLFEGKKQINLSDPYDKGLTIDVTTNWELERYGILTWDSRFVVLRVNDQVVGLFQEIEQFGRSSSAAVWRIGTAAPRGSYFPARDSSSARRGWAMTRPWQRSNG